MIRIPVLLIAAMVVGCGPSQAPEPEAPAEPVAETAAERDAESPDETAAERLEAVLAARPEDARARDAHRHPQQTLGFFGIVPGMTVVEGLPGAGWYSQILIPYLGPDGRLIGANYPHSMWPRFGFFDQELIDSMLTWTTDWPDEARAWHGNQGAAVDAFDFGAMPAELEGQADAVLLIRTLHNLARFEDDGGYLTTVVDEVHRVLKPGGILAVVQHEARPDAPDDWASGARGYLKKQFVIDRLTAAGFEFVADSDINENPNDRPGPEDHVWRLPPTYATSQEDPELRAQMEAIGESHRMTLKFRKP